MYIFMKPQKVIRSDVKFLKNVKMFLGFVTYFSSPVSRGLFQFFFSMLFTDITHLNKVIVCFSYFKTSSGGTTYNQDKLFFFSLSLYKIYNVNVFLHTVFHRVCCFCHCKLLGLWTQKKVTIPTIIFQGLYSLSLSCEWGWRGQMLSWVTHGWEFPRTQKGLLSTSSLPFLVDTRKIKWSHNFSGDNVVICPLVIKNLR